MAAIGLAGLGAAAFIAPYSASAAPPSGGININTNASLDPGAGNQNGVNIECSWALEDVDNNWGNAMTYKAGALWGDSSPSSSPEETPCAGRPPAQADSDVVHIDVLPNSHDMPTEQYVELWMAVDYLADPDSGNNPLVVDFEVYHPDGSLKFQVPASRYVNCNGPSGMFDAAVQTGQVSRNSIGTSATLDTDTMLNLCTQGVKFLYYGAFPISKHQPWGEYTIIASAEDDFGADTLEYKINVMPFYDLRTDFTSVDWPVLTRGAHKRVIGDFDLTNASRPTVVNRGNAGISIGVVYDEMCLVGFEAQCNVDRKNIDEFDAAFGVRHDLLVAVGDEQVRPNVVTGDQGSTRVPADTLITFESGGAIQPGQSLCPNDRGKVEFSLYTDSDQERGDYEGAVTVFAIPLIDDAEDTSYCPTDNGSVYFGDFEYNQYEVNPNLISSDHWNPA
jgi:hypothetical protein